MKRNQPRRWWQLGLLLLMGGYLIIRRYPILYSNYEINPDESQLLAQALTLWHHVIYWRYVDGATMGPLSSYLTALPAFLGLPLDYLAARWIGFGCTLVTIVMAYLAINNFFNWHGAMLALLPLVVFTGYTQDTNFVHDTNEQLSLALISICLWQFSHLIRYKLAAEVRWLFWLSFTASLVPFAKLQGTLSALVIVLAAFLYLFRQRGHLTTRVYRRSVVGFLTGGVVFPVIFTGLTVYFGVFNDFIEFYIKGNAVYGTDNSFWTDAWHFIKLISQTRDFVLFLLPTAGLVLIRFLWPERTTTYTGLLLFCVVLLLANAYAIVKPGNAFSHYLLYLMVPISLLNAYLIGTVRLPGISVGIGLVLLVYTPITVNDAYLWYTHQPLSQYTTAHQQMTLSSVAKVTLKYAHPGEDLVVWGWMPRYNVQTQMPQGVADNHVIRCLLGSPAAQRIHRNRYMQNIRRSKPPVFIDSVGENCLWLNDRSRFAHEVFPELNDYVSKNYRYVGEVDYTRIYVRIDRYNSH